MNKATQVTARDRAIRLITGCLSGREDDLLDTLRELAEDTEPQATPAVIVVLAGMNARMARALAEDDDDRVENMIDTAVSDEIDRNAPRAEG